MVEIYFRGSIFFWNISISSHRTLFILKGWNLLWKVEFYSHTYISFIREEGYFHSQTWKHFISKNKNFILKNQYFHAHSMNVIFLGGLFTNWDIGAVYNPGYSLQNIWNKIERNPVKLGRTRKFQYLLLRVLWLLLPKFNFWNRDWALGFTQIWDFSNIF